MFRVEERFEKARQRLGEAGQDDFEFDFMVTVTWTNTIPAVGFKPDSESVHKILIPNHPVLCTRMFLCMYTLFHL